MNGKGSNLPIIKKQNNALIKDIVYRESPISRSEIAQKLSLTAPTIATNVLPLLESGLLREFAPSVGDGEARALGRRPIMLDFVPNAKYVVGVELGPYRTTCVITDLRGEVIRSEILANALISYDDMLPALSGDISRLISDADISRDRILGIGVGLPGFINSSGGIIYNNFRKDWVRRNLASDLQELQHLPVKIENNVRARAVGADLFDKLVTSDPLAYYFVSYGLACPLVIDKKILYGGSAGAGEVGHMVVEPNGPRCDVCGNTGCLDAVASERAIVKRCAELMTARANSILPSLCPDATKLNIENVITAQECSDTLANTVINDALDYIGVNVANIINLISPRTILIDAFIATYAPNRERLMDIITNNIFGYENKHLKIEFVPYDVLYAARGAAATAIREFLLDCSE